MHGTEELWRRGGRSRAAGRAGNVGSAGTASPERLACSHLCLDVARQQVCAPGLDHGVWVREERFDLRAGGDRRACNGLEAGHHSAAAGRPS